MVIEIPDVVLNKQITIKGLQHYANCFYFLIAFPFFHSCVYISLVINFDSYFPCLVDSIIVTPKELSITYIPSVGVPAYATSTNFRKLLFSIPHTALPSPHPTGNFLLNYFLIIFQFFLLGFIYVIFILDIKSSCVIKLTCIFWYKCKYYVQ